MKKSNNCGNKFFTGLLIFIAVVLIIISVVIILDKLVPSCHEAFNVACRWVIELFTNPPKANNTIIGSEIRSQVNRWS